MPTYEGEVLADAPAFYWRLDDDNVVPDASGNGRSAYFGGSISFLAPTLLVGDDGHAIGFHGSVSEYIFISANFGFMDAMPDKPAFTIEAIINADVVTGTQVLVGRWFTDLEYPDDTSRQRWALRINNGVLEFLLRGAAGYHDDFGFGVAFVGTPIEAAETYHVAAVFDGGTMYLYVNGNLVGQNSQDAQYQNQHLLVGVDGNNAQDAFAGVVDEIAYYLHVVPGVRLAAHSDRMLLGPASDPIQLTPSTIAVSTPGAFQLPVQLTPSSIAVDGIRGHFDGPGMQVDLTPSEIGVGGPVGMFDLPPEIVVVILDPEIDEAPGVLTVLVSMLPEGPVTFTIGGEEVWTDTADETGVVGPVSIEVPEGLAAGQHELEVTAAGASGADTFTVLNAPSSLPDVTPPHADPVAIPDATGRWVLQDLLPGGLGSWVMHPGPTSAQPIPVTKTLQATQTTYAGGKIHVTEGQSLAADWSFAGYCPDRAFYDKLAAYGALNRRCYVIDHRGRAFMVAFLGPDLVPRKRQHDDAGGWNDWSHDYTMRCLFFEEVEL